MRTLVIIGSLLATAAAMENYFRMPAPFSYSCSQDGKCIREKRFYAENYMSLGACTLSCGEYGSLWPKPTGKVQLGADLVSFNPDNVRFTKLGVSSKRVEGMLDDASHYFLRKLHFKHPEYPMNGKGPFTEFDYQDNKYNKFDDQEQNHFRSSFNKDYQNYESMMMYEKMSPFNKERSNPASQNHMVNIEVTVTSGDHELRLDTDESYHLVFQTVGDTTTVTILASTYYGARHALESLSQMMAYDELNNSLMMLESAQISDEPAFEYRGIMLDTGRNYYPKDEIMRLLDTMSSNKLNTFHWHIADSASFPMYSPRQPLMTYTGAYSPSKVYYPEDIRKIVNYANLRGIRVVPELSAPGNTGAGWTFGEDSGKGKLVLCADEERPWFENCKEPPCGQLNPANPEVYNVLKELYSDIMDAFDPEMVHMGGDDVSFKCWRNSPEISTYLSEKNNKSSGAQLSVDERSRAQLSSTQYPSVAPTIEEPTSAELFELWNTFQETAYSKLSEASERRSTPVMPIIYSSPLVRKHIDHNKYIVQLTKDATDSEVEGYFRNNYKVIFSNSDAWNFKGSANSWIDNKSPKDTLPSSWKEVYEINILNEYGVKGARTTNNAETIRRDLVLGGEATIWSSGTDSANLQTTAWPRASAMAERLWSKSMNNDHGAFNADEAQNRLAAHRERMVSEGTQAEVFQPEYCFRNQDSCFSEADYKYYTDYTNREVKSLVVD